MRVTIHAHEKVVWIRVWLPGENDEPLWFRRDVATKAEANAIARGIEEDFSRQTESIRRCAYWRGRESMRDKMQAVNKFSRCFNSTDVI